MLIQHYLEVARPYLERYGYASVFAGVLVEGFGIPAPGQTLIIAGAILASEGQLNILILLIVAWTAAVMGDNIWDRSFDLDFFSNICADLAKQ